MKVIFLDIDGVLNYTDWYVDDRNPGNLYGEEGDIDPLCANRIINICNNTEAKVVITSDWRLSWYGTQIRLARMGLDENLVIDKTPERPYVSIRGYDHSRGAEINDWLFAHPECNNYVIIDDRTDFKENQMGNFIHINRKIGITDEDMNKAIAILNKN
jgi:hypothetical protein